MSHVRSLSTFLFTLLAAFLFILLTPSVHSQGVAISSNPSTTADSSAILDLVSTNKGMLVPRMTAAQRTVIPVPALGLLVYQTDAPSGYYFFEGASWILLGGDHLTGSGADGQLSFWTSGGNLTGDPDLVYNSVDSYLGIGTDTPTAGVHISNKDGFLSEGSFGAGKNPSNGGNTLMMWYPRRAAFRAGHLPDVYKSYWDSTHVGDSSVAMGHAAYGKGIGAVALGMSPTAAGKWSVAIGPWALAN